VAIGPLSDAAGLRAAYALCALQIPAVLSLPAIAGNAPADPEKALALWKVATCAVPAFYGGYVVLLAPAVARTFGSRRVGSVFPRIFAVLNLSNLASSTVIGRQREAAMEAAATDLAGFVDDAVFLEHFGTAKTDLARLVAVKTCTIPSLLAIAPAGTPDPSPLIHHDTLHLLGWTSALAVACHAGALWLGPRPTAAPR